MSYKIEISYRTEGSLHTEDTTDVLELEWNDLNAAKANLKRIQEHYKMYQELHEYRSKKTDQEIFAKNAEKDWFVAVMKGGQYDEFMAEDCLNLFTDSGNKMQMTAFWIGYFEQLYGAKVIVAVDTELEFTV